MMTKPLFGKLYVVATPIGHLDDMTFRAVDTLKQADLVAAEDTRHSKKLLSHFNISTRLISCHEHNESQKIPYFISRLKEGMNIALISDAGTPCISDPGYALVSAAANAGVDVVPIPGCSAAVAGLSVSGLPTDSFLFIGFLPKKQKKRLQAFERIKDQAATLIIYESPKRIKKLISEIISAFGDRTACLAREITKRHEEFIRGTLSDLLARLDAKPQVKGEITLFIDGCVSDNRLDANQLEAIVIEKMSTSRNLSTADLTREICQEFKIRKKDVYNLILRHKSGKIVK